MRVIVVLDLENLKKEANCFEVKLNPKNNKKKANKKVEAITLISYI